MKYLDAAHEILRQEGQSLHVQEIIRRAKEQKLIESRNQRAPYALGSQISAEITKEGEHSRFVKDKAVEATYGLRDYSAPPPRPQPRQSQPAGGRSGKRKGPDFVGPGGEALVQSELLFREYEVSKPVPDIGVDIVARKDGEAFYIQVKTRNMAEGPYSYDIKKRSFERTPRQGTYYVFVMRNPSAGSADFIVLPHAEMAAMIKKGDIRQTKRQPASYQVIFTQKSGAVKCKGRNMINFKNNWDIA